MTSRSGRGWSRDRNQPAARLLGITKRGNIYLCTLLIHGPRAALLSLSAGQTAIWLVAALPDRTLRHAPTRMGSQLVSYRSTRTRRLSARTPFYSDSADHGHAPGYRFMLVATVSLSTGVRFPPEKLS